jgi:hypothetical protein
MHAHVLVQAIPMPERGLRHAGPLIIALIYVSCASAPRNARTSIFGLFTVPTRYYPYAVVLLNLVQGGPRDATRALAGALVGHLWWYVAWIRVRARFRAAVADARRARQVGRARDARARALAARARVGQGPRRGQRAGAAAGRHICAGAPLSRRRGRVRPRLGSRESAPLSPHRRAPCGLVGSGSAAACCDEHTVLMRYGM